MKQLIITALVLATTWTTGACNKIKGSGPVVTESRNTGRFTRINNDISGDVFYSPATEYHVEVHAQKNILSLLRTRVNGDELEISFEPGKWVGNHDKISVYVSGPDVRAFSVNGSGSLKVTGAYRPEQLELRVSGSGDISIADLYTGNISSRVTGSGSIRALNGTAVNIKTEISGSGTIDLIGVAAKSGVTRTSGSGETYIQVSDNLEVSISGSGDVYYRGHPSISKNISGSGSVIAR